MGSPIYFDKTGQEEIDAVLEAVRLAASCYHNANQWYDEVPGIESPMDRIVRVAKESATKLATAEQSNTELLGLLKEANLEVWDYAQEAHRDGDHEVCDLLKGLHARIITKLEEGNDG